MPASTRPLLRTVVRIPPTLALLLACHALALGACTTDESTQAPVPVAPAKPPGAAGAPAIPTLPGAPPASPMPGSGVAICTIGSPEPQAYLKADVPAGFDAARMWIFEACKNERDCWKTQVADHSTLESDADGAYIKLPLSTAPSHITLTIRLYRADMRISFIEVDWMNLRDAASGDHFTITATDPQNGSHTLFDETVTYRPKSHTIGPNCGTNWVQADVDTREEDAGAD